LGPDPNLKHRLHADLLCGLQLLRDKLHPAELVRLPPRVHEHVLLSALVLRWDFADIIHAKAKKGKKGQAGMKF
jgi:hypothetical protein